MYCLDASVIVNSIIEKEDYHEHSKNLMLKIKNQNILVVLPEIALPEIASAISKGTGNAELSLQFIKELRRIPNFVFIPVDADISDFASRLAAEKQLRGADAVYVAIASIFNMKLITLDEEQRRKSKDIVKAITPMDELGE